MLPLPFFFKKIKIQKNKKNKKYLNKETKMQKKKMNDQSVFGTKQWGGKRQIILPISKWLSHTRKMGCKKNLKKIQKKKPDSLPHLQKTLNLFCYFLATSHHTRKSIPTTSIFMAKKWLNPTFFMPIVTITSSLPPKLITTSHCPATPHRTKKKDPYQIFD